MTIPSTPFRKDHTLTGAIVPLLYDWKVLSKNHLLVTLVNTSVTPNVETTLAVDTDYTVNSVGADTGTITPALAYTAGWKIVITPNLPFEQDTDFTNQNSVKPEEVEAMADKLARQIKQILETLSRTVKTAVGGGVQPDDLLDAINDAVTNSNANAALTAADVVTTGNNVTSAQAAQAAAESAAAGIKWRPSVRASTTAALPSVTYNNGASGVGATLTATANGALAAQDGVTLTAGQRLLVKDQAAQLQNGVYTVTQVGTGGTPFILTRATDADTWLELVSQAIIIEEGTTLLDTAYICTVNQGGTIGTNNVTFSSFTVAPTTTPAGIINPYAGSSAPTGWLLCGGQAVSRTTYSSLFSAIGVVFGSGDGSTTFNVPDLRGRTIAGIDNMNGTAANRITSGGSGIVGTNLGAAGGTETHQLTTTQLPSHTHGPGTLGTDNHAGHAHTLGVQVGGNVWNAGTGNGANNSSGLSSTSTAGAHTHAVTTGVTGSAGSDTAHQNTQPTMMLNYIIKT